MQDKKSMIHSEFALFLIVLFFLAGLCLGLASSPFYHKDIPPLGDMDSRWNAENLEYISPLNEYVVFNATECIMRDGYVYCEII